MASTQLIHKLEESVFECQFCKTEFMYILFDWHYHSKNQIDCVECHSESESDDEFICKDCWENAFQVCDECGEAEPPKLNENKLTVYNDCEYCQKFLGLVIGGDIDTTPCKTCGTDYANDGKMKTVCPTCRNHLN